jgi:hypothetical protein
MTVIVIRCDRCGRRCRNPAAFVTDEWNATLRQGVVVGYVPGLPDTGGERRGCHSRGHAGLWPGRAGRHIARPKG